METERLIAKYFQNQLSAEEKVQFDKLMSSNKEFKEQVMFEEKVKKSIVQQEHINFKQYLKNVEQSLPRKKNKTRWYLVAASILMLVSLGLLWNLNANSPDKLFDSYYKVASNTSFPIVRNNTASDELTKAFIAYESKAYNQAQTLFAEAYKNSNNSELLFYLGISFLETGDTKKAIETFLKHIKFNDRLAGKSNWYLALTYLKANDVERSKKILKKIASNSTNYNYKKAKSLYSKL